MREIKFRAWDKVEQEMICGALEIKDIGLGEGTVLVDEKTQRGNELAWQQYTDLKDKNGKEIYEGDLIKNESGRICEVKWLRGYGRWDAFVRKTVKGDSPRGFNPEDWSRCVEVIGNIYENP